MNSQLKSQNESINFIAEAPSSLKILSLARRIAKHNVPVLITGETGTGKECIAKYIHQHAFVDEAPYIALNCAAIPETMLEAILFGYEKGAFTGAISSVAGKFELANGGTLLLDEIGDMPLALQAKLLRVIQEQEVERLGSHKKISLNIRLIASTNKDLKQEIFEGRFREDLYYRLAVVPIHIPPLRKRPEDILPISLSFLKKYERFSAEKLSLSNEAIQLLQGYKWPGNVRELENVIQRSIIMTDCNLIQAKSLGLYPPVLEEAELFDQRAVTVEKVLKFQEPIVEQDLKVRGRLAEYQYIIDLLKQNNGNKSKTAEFLGITPRALRYRLASMRELGIDTQCFA